MNEIRHKMGKGYSNCSTYIANITKDRQNTHKNCMFSTIHGPMSTHVDMYASILVERSFLKIRQPSNVIFDDSAAEKEKFIEYVQNTNLL